MFLAHFSYIIIHIFELILIATDIAEANLRARFFTKIRDQIKNLDYQDFLTRKKNKNDISENGLCSNTCTQYQRYTGQKMTPENAASLPILIDCTRDDYSTEYRKPRNIPRLPIEPGNSNSLHALCSSQHMENHFISLLGPQQRSVYEDDDVKLLVPPLIFVTKD